MIDVGSAIGYLMLDTSGFESGFKSAMDDLETFQDKTATVGDKFGALGSAMSTIGGNLTKSITLPLVGAGTALVGFASNAETSFANFQAKVGEVNGSMEEYRDVMDQVYANNYGENFEDISDAMATIVTVLGEMDPSNMQEVTESALTLKDTFGYDVSESIRTVDTLMKNFGMTAEEAFDYIVKGQQSGLDYSGEFLDTLNEYSVQFTKLGFTADDMFAILQEGAENGAWNLDKIGDAVKEFSIRVIDGSDTTEMGFSRIGLNAEEMAAKFAKGGDDAKEAFQETINALASMDNAVMQNIAGTELFGTMWEDLGPDVVLQLANISGAAVDTEGAMSNLKNVKYDTLQSAVEGLGRQMALLGTEIGETLLPRVEQMIDFVSSVVDKFSNMDESTKNLIVNVGLVVASIGPLLLVFGKISSAIGSIISLVSGAGGLSGVLAALTGPVGIVIAAVAALAVAWATDFAGIRDTTSAIFGSVVEIIQTIWTTIQTLWNENFMGIQSIAQVVWDAIQGIFSGAFDALEGLFAAFESLFKGDWEGFWDGIKQFFSGIMDAIGSLLEGALDALVLSLIAIGKSIYEAAVEAYTNIKTAFTEVWDSIKEWFEEAINDPIGTIKGIGTDLYDAGKEIFTSLWDGLKSVWTDIKNWVSDTVDWLVDKVKFWEDESEKISTPTSVDGRGGGFGDGGGGISGSYASGLDYVPRDMNVRVHEGESIWTKNQTRDLINAMSTLMTGNGQRGDLTVVVPVNGVELARATIKDFRFVERSDPNLKG